MRCIQVCVRGFHPQHAGEDARTLGRMNQTRGSKDLKNYTGSVNFFKPWYVTPPPPLLPKIDMSDQKRQFQEKHIAFLVLKEWEEYENISVCLYKLQKGIFSPQLV